MHLWACGLLSEIKKKTITVPMAFATTGIGAPAAVFFPLSLQSSATTSKSLYLLPSSYLAHPSSTSSLSRYRYRKKKTTHVPKYSSHQNDEISRGELIWRATKLPIYSVAMVPLTVSDIAVSRLPFSYWINDIEMTGR